MFLSGLQNIYFFFKIIAQLPVVEGVLDELKGHVYKNSLAVVLLLFVAMIKDDLRQVWIFPYQHPHGRVKDLLNFKVETLDLGPPDCQDVQELPDCFASPPSTDCSL